MSAGVRGLWSKYRGGLPGSLHSKTTQCPVCQLPTLPSPLNTPWACPASVVAGPLLAVPTHSSQALSPGPLRRS